MTSLIGACRTPGVRRRNLMRGVAAGCAALLLALAQPGPAAAQNSGGQNSGGQDSGGQDSGGQDSGGQDSGGQNDATLAEGASSYITELSRTAIAQLSPTDISAAERAERARTILEENFAGRDLARFVLGRYWRVASEPQRERFMTLLREVALTRFLPTFQHMSMDQVTIERAIADPQAKGVARVITRVDVPNRAPVKLAWRVRPTDDGSYQIVDIMAEGVSMAITLRSEYSSVIEQNGGQIEALLTRLEERLQSNGAPDWAKSQGG